AASPGQTGFSVVAIAAVGDVVVGAATQNGGSFVRVTDTTLSPLNADAPIAQPPGGPRAVAPTGLATDPIAAVTTIPAAGNQTVLYGINTDGSLTAPLALGAGATLATSSLANIGDRLAL